MGNRLTSGVFKHLLRFEVQDTQTGLRGIPNHLIDACLQLSGKRFEYETLMLTEVGKNLGILEIPIETVYYQENAGSHFNPIIDSIKIYATIFGTFFPYILSSLSCNILDMFLFVVFSKVLLTKVSNRIFVATCIARVFSSIFNFCLNKNVVFKSGKKYAITAVQYFILCVAQTMISALLVSKISVLTMIDEVLIKMFVDTMLFFISYQIQHKLIFKKN